MIGLKEPWVLKLLRVKFRIQSNICGAGMFPSIKPDRINEHAVCTEDEHHQKLHRPFTGLNLIGFPVICTPQETLNRKKQNDVTRPDVYCHRGGETVQFYRKNSHFAKNSNASIFRSVTPWGRMGQISAKLSAYLYQTIRSLILEYSIIFVVTAGLTSQCTSCRLHVVKLINLHFLIFPSHSVGDLPALLVLWPMN